MHSLRCLQPGGKITTCDDVQLGGGRWDLRVWHGEHLAHIEGPLSRGAVLSSIFQLDSSLTRTDTNARSADTPHTPWSAQVSQIGYLI